MNSCKYHEKVVLNKYFRWYLQEYLGMVTLYILAVIIFFSGSVSKRFPIDAIIYPFPTDSTPVYVPLYIHQFFAIFQTSTLIGIDFCVNTLLWYTVARFEILSLRLRSVKCNDQLKKCIFEHQDIVR